MTVNFILIPICELFTMARFEAADSYLQRIANLVEGREYLLLFLFVLWVPLATGNFSLSTDILIFAMFAMGYHISLGETGMLTFGHAAFFGLGAYGSAFWLIYAGAPAWLGFVGLLTGAGLATVGGLVIGALSLRRRGTYLALITLAFQQMLYFIFFQWESVTGGDDGLFGVTAPEFGIPGVFLLRFQDGFGGLVTRGMVFFGFTFVVFVVMMLLLRRLKRSNFGRVLNGIRENEDRANFLGYDVQRYRLSAFTVSALFSGVAGALYPMYLNFVGLDTLNWVLSGEVNFYVLLGGLNTFIGPVIGALSYFWIVDEISAVTEHWQLFVGAIFILIVLFFPDGIVGTAKEYLSERTSYTTNYVPSRSNE